jgi:hypothetical protein
MSEKDDLFSTSSGGEQAPLVSPGRDLRKLKKNSAATAGELKALLAQMKGKGAGEVLGAVAASDLGRSLLVATGGAAVLILVFTVVPFAWGLVGGDVDGDGGAVVEGQRAKEKVVAEGQGEAESVGEEEAQAEEVVEVNLLNGGETVEKLGIGETMEAPVDVNPLEGATDDLLKDLD